MLKRLALGLLVLGSAVPAHASSDDAWTEFAAEVEAGCLAATSDMLSDAQATVDPFGSESYGLAIVTGEVTDGAQASIICVFDKKTKAVEIGGELDVTVTPGAAS